MNLEEILSNKYVTTGISVILVLYAALLGPNLPPVIQKLFTNTIFRIIVLFMVVITANKEPKVAIMIAVAFILTLDYIYVLQAKETFTNVQEASTVSSVDSMVGQGTSTVSSVDNMNMVGQGTSTVSSVDNMNMVGQGTSTVSSVDNMNMVGQGTSTVSSVDNMNMVGQGTSTVSFVNNMNMVGQGISTVSSVDNMIGQEISTVSSVDNMIGQEISTVSSIDNMNMSQKTIQLTCTLPNNFTV